MGARGLPGNNEARNTVLLWGVLVAMEL